MNSSHDRQFTGIVQSHSSQLFFVAYRITKDRQVAEDIVQEAFLRLWKHRVKIIHGNPGGWLYRVVNHLGYRYVKRSCLHVQAIHELSATTGAHSCDVEENLISKENDELLGQLLQRMPPKQKMVYHLSREEGLRRNEIASRLHLSPNTVKVHLHRAVQFMKENIACVILFALFFFLNTFIFRSSNTKTVPGDLNSIRQVIEKELPEATMKPDLTATPASGKMILLNMFTIK